MTSQRPRRWFFGTLLLALASCSPAPEVDDSDPLSRLDGGLPPSGDGGAGAGLPCDVAKVLSERCTGCHGAPLTGYAPMPLLSYADLTRRSAQFPDQTLAQRSVARMKDPQRPMPPRPALAATPAEIDVLSAWVDAAAPMGSGGCGMTPDNPFDKPPQCTTMKTWTSGDKESQLMHPGMACIRCHTDRRKGPSLVIAGTVYATGHEPNDCLGAAAVQVQVTDSKGVSRTLTANSSGNFLLRSDANLSAPFQVKVLHQGRARAMQGAAPHGDCNACHTQNGANKAPGRIVIPY